MKWIKPVVGAVALLLAASSCSTRTIEQEGAGWPNVALSAQTDTAESVRVTAIPQSIGPDGAVFTVEIDLPDDQIASVPTLASLTVDGMTWGSPSWKQESAPQAGTVSFELHFEGGGPSIGLVQLEIGRSTSVHHFEWRI